MSDPNQVDRDLREFLEKEKNLHRQDKLDYLKALFAKYFALNKLNHVVNKNDLFGIISDSKRKYVEFNLPLQVSGRAVDPSELPAIAMIEALVSYLNRNHLLNRLPKIDYSEEAGYDSLEDT
jgi:hypothetical protein